MIDGGVFVTGTDTEVGKTLVSCAMLTALARAGHCAFALKPVAAGAMQVDGHWRNDDALALMAHAGQTLAYDEVNPCLLQAPVAPHIAADWEGRSLTLASLLAHCKAQALKRSGLMLVEGAGGWRVPLNAGENLSDLAIALALPVVLVVPIRLGCLNHALLTAEAIRRDGLRLAGWVANMVRPEYAPGAALIETLNQSLGAPCLGRLPWLELSAAQGSGTSAAVLADHLELPGLLKAFGAMQKQS